MWRYERHPPSDVRFHEILYRENFNEILHENFMKISKKFQYVE